MSDIPNAGRIIIEAIVRRFPPQDHNTVRDTLVQNFWAMVDTLESGGSLAKFPHGSSFKRELQDRGYPI